MLTLSRLSLYRISLLSFVTFGLGAIPARADSLGADSPYHYQVVLRFAENRAFTTRFKEEVARDVRNWLQSALGDLAEVEVVLTHPRLKDIEEKGMQVLDTWHEADDLKTHFVLVDFVDGQYQVQARQFDGYAGLPGQLRKAERTADRPFLARLIALTLDRDFGLVGTVESADLKNARVVFKGGALVPSLDGWVQPGEVFALIQPGPTPVRLQWTLLQLEKTAVEDGKVVGSCRILHPGVASPLPPGCRCIKLGTTEGPLHLRTIVARSKSRQPFAGLRVLVSSKGYSDDSGAGKEEGLTGQDGLFSPIEKDRPPVRYDHVAFVSVYEGSQLKVQVPVPIIEQDTFICPVNTENDPLAQLRDSVELWERQLLRCQQEQVTLVEEIKAIPDKRPEDALKKAQDGLDKLDRNLLRLASERTRLLDEAKRFPGRALDLKSGDKRLEDLRSSKKDMAAYVVKLDEIVKKEKDPRLQQLLQLLTKGELDEKEADCDEALKKYDEALKLGLPLDEAWTKKIDSLKKEWPTTDPALLEARTFIYERFPQLKLAGLKENMQQARDALETCRKAKDYRSPIKLKKVANAHYTALKEDLARLRPDLNFDQEERARELEGVLKDLEKLIDEVNKFLSSKQSK
jgi:hypothetical protein